MTYFLYDMLYVNIITIKYIYYTIISLYNNDYNITINYNYNPCQKLCLFKYNYIYVITSYHCIIIV